MSEIPFATYENWIILGDATDSTLTLNKLSNTKGPDGQLHFPLMNLYNSAFEEIWNEVLIKIKYLGLKGARLANTMGDGFLVLGVPETGIMTSGYQMPLILEFAKKIKYTADEILSKLKQNVNNMAEDKIGNILLKENQNLKMRILISHGNVYESFLHNRYMGDSINYGSKILSYIYRDCIGEPVIFVDNLPNGDNLWLPEIIETFEQYKIRTKPINLDEIDDKYINHYDRVRDPEVYKIPIDRIDLLVGEMKQRLGDNLKHSKDDFVDRVRWFFKNHIHWINEDSFKDYCPF
ncbi:MAG: hypothetical protein A2161_05225 [Candidatus Schekmanbacteria bacterium RBG_13_48_7]|uniref:Guanylate cyclase domain-containing protein n=1 Tax=Candidatus Schekmanbacteria bacterium RBG_13_48_7 TaxID=1817878 RepID=A0A1F7RN33_9BACT|nr:MAG: hypothetical protein A2161_05225 [Candidatus Schekmanbacteria bacterium RBG_13_48_7]